LVHEGPPRSAPQEGSALPERINFIEKENGRALATGVLEDLVQAFLAFTEPHVEDLGETDRVEPGTNFTGQRPRQERLSATGRPVEYEPASDLLSESPMKLRIAQRRQEAPLELCFHVFHASDVGEP
jgi:hypothetical protein